MNYWTLSAGVVAFLTTLGHFIVGKKGILVPMLRVRFDEVSQKTMHCAFHYISAFMVLSTGALLAAGAGINEDRSLVMFIAATYAAFAGIQIVIALASGLRRSLLRLFQWTLFLLIALLAWIGQGQ